MISQPIITQATAQPTTSAVMTYSTNTAVAAYKPALLPTPAAMTAPTAGASQLDPFAVAAAAALLLARFVYEMFPNVLLLSLLM